MVIDGDRKLSSEVCMIPKATPIQGLNREGNMIENFWP
jgi:hypothetical protein